MSKQMKIYLFYIRSIFLVAVWWLSSLNIVFAGNTDVSGRWELKIDYSEIIQVEETVTINGRETRNSRKEGNPPWPNYLNFTVTQSPDGAFSGKGDNFLIDTDTITGNTNTYNISFTRIATNKKALPIKDNSKYNYKISAIWTEDFTGTVDKKFGGSIDNERKSRGVFKGTYYAEESFEIRQKKYTEYHSIKYNGTRNGTYEIRLSPIPEIKTTLTALEIGGVDGRNVTMKWESTGGDGGGVVAYEYYFDSKSPTQITVNSATLENLDYGQHNFRIRGIDGMGNLESIGVIEFFHISRPVTKPVTPKPPPNPLPKDSNLGNQPAKSTGDPVNSVTGNMYIITEDLRMPSRGIDFEFTRSYNSQDNKDSPLGYGWTHSYNLSLIDDRPNGIVKLKDGQGRSYIFADNTDGSYTAQRGEYSILTKINNEFYWRKKDGRVCKFDLSGKLLQISDRNENTVSFSYDNQGRLVKITDTVQRVVNFAYSQQNKIISIAGPLDRSFTYAYDANNNLIKVTDPKGNTTVYEYDSNHNLTKKTNPKGESVYFSYDTIDRCISSSGENNQGRVDLVYDEANKKTTITDSMGNKTTISFNDDLMITKNINPQGAQTQSAWDTNLNLISRTDELGRTTRMTYEKKGNLEMLANPGGAFTFFMYSPNLDLMTKVFDAQANITTYTYDPKGNLLEAKDSLGNTTTYTYNSFGQPLTVTNPLGKVSNFTYDLNGNLAASKDPLSNITTFDYDSLGNLTQSKDTKGNITKYAYDELNQLTQVTYPDNSINTFTYDGNGNRASLTDAESRVTSYSYDQNNRVRSVTDPAGNKITYDYDTEGNLVAVSDQNNHQTKYSYDSLNRLTEQEDALGRKTKYEYDPAGNLLKKTDTKGQIFSYEYDSLNRLKKIVYPASSVSFKYDFLDRRKSMTDSRGTTTYDYDKLSRLTKIDGPGQNDTLEYGYDKASNRISMTDPDGKATKYGYDDANCLSSITDPQGKLTNYEYDQLGNLTGIILPNGIKTVSTYDTLNRLSKLTQQKGANPQVKLAEFTYGYDRAGRRTSVQLLDGSRLNYGYDSAGRLTSETRTSAQTPYQISYEYDLAGNRSRMANNGLIHNYSYNELNQLIEDNITSVTARSTKITVTGQILNASSIKSVTVNGLAADFDGSKFTCSNVPLAEGSNTITVKALNSAGSTLSTKSITVTYAPSKKISYEYDLNGNLARKTSGAKTTDYTYDIENRLTKATTSGKEVLYQYDGEGKRTRFTDGGSSTDFLYDGMSAVTERSPSGTTTASYTRNPFAPGGIGGIISQQSNSPRYYLYDGQGSISGTADSGGSLMSSSDYDAFGNLINQSGITSSSHRYSTKEQDSTGLLYYGARYYDPATGRFLTPDPSGMSDGPNLYLYCLGDPINSVDLWGLRKKNSMLDKLNSLLPFIAGNAQWHSDYNKVGEKLIDIFYKGAKYRFNNLGELVEHTGEVIGKATGKAARALEYLKNVKPNFFLRLPVIIIIVPPEAKSDSTSPFYDPEYGDGNIT